MKRRRSTTTNPIHPGWYFSYGKPDPAMNADGVSSIWTASPYVEPHYWLKNWTTPFQKTQTISITYRVDVLEGNPVVKSTECTATQNPAAKAALIIRRSTNNADYFNRAWWTTRGPVTPGVHTITAPFGEGAGWTFVAADGNPLNYPAKWNEILSSPIDIGLTFNGCSSMGHGCYVVDGTIKITIVSVTVL